MWLKLVKILFGSYSRQYNEAFQLQFPQWNSMEAFGCTGISGYELMDSFFTNWVNTGIISPLSPALPEYIPPFGDSPRKGRKLFGESPMVQYESNHSIQMIQITKRLQNLYGLNSVWFIRYSFVDKRLFMVSFMQPTLHNHHKPLVAETYKLAGFLSPGIHFQNHGEEPLCYTQATHMIQIYNGLFCSQIRISDVETLSLVADPLMRFVDKTELNNKISTSINKLKVNKKIEPA